MASSRTRELLVLAFWIVVVLIVLSVLVVAVLAIFTDTTMTHHTGI
jgi:hypothetical protein